MTGAIEGGAGELVIRVKAVPGAATDAVAGVLGDRLKVRIGAPPKGGRANRAIITLLSRRLGVNPSRIELRSGRSGPEKTLAIVGVTPEGLGRALGIDPGPIIVQGG